MVLCVDSSILAPVLEGERIEWCLYLPPTSARVLKKRVGSSFTGGWQYLQRCLSWAGENFPTSKAKKNISKSLGLLETHGI